MCLLSVCRTLHQQLGQLPDEYPSAHLFVIGAAVSSQLIPPMEDLKSPCRRLFIGTHDLRTQNKIIYLLVWIAYLHNLPHSSIKPQGPFGELRGWLEDYMRQQKDQLHRALFLDSTWQPTAWYLPCPTSSSPWWRFSPVGLLTSSGPRNGSTLSRWGRSTPPLEI